MKTYNLIFCFLIFAVTGFSQVPNWSTQGNAGITPSADFIGTLDEDDLRFRTDDDPRMVLTGDNGWLGLHTMGPLAPFTIFGGDVLWYNNRVVDVGVLTPLARVCNACLDIVFSSYLSA